MQNLEPQQLIGAGTLFRNLQPHEAAAIIARLQSASYERGSRILERGVWHGQLYIVASGQVSVLLQEGEQASAGAHPHGNHAGDLVVAHLGPGECFGEMSLITGEPPGATIRAEQDTALWMLTQADFLTLVGACPTLLQNINRILSLRLAQTNQQILANHSAERVWLSFIHDPGKPLELSLAVHVAGALAVRSRQRVLMLELCGQDQALGPHFAVYEQQVRPTFLECVRDRSLLQAHHAPTTSPAGQYYPAYAALAATHEQILALDGGILASLSEFATLYDYLLLVTTRATPNSLAQAVEGQSQRTMTLVSAGAEPGEAFASSLHGSIFVAHVPERPTIGVQDRFAAQLGCSVTRLFPADTSLLEQCWEQQKTLSQAAPGAALTGAVDFMARHIAHQTIGVAFGGGGARGFAHLGLKRMLRDLCGELRFEDLTTPFAMVAVDLTTRAGVVLDRGLLWQAALASVSLPGIFPPVLVGEHILMDAGMHDPVPIRLTRRMGADILIASELGGQEPPSLVSATPWQTENVGTGFTAPRSPHIIDLLLRTYDLAMATIGMHSIREADIVIRPKLHRVSLRQFSEGRKFVAAGREAVEQSLPALRKRLPWL